MSEIKVSICCTVYNHEKYLKKCLDGFVMQKTNFHLFFLLNFKQFTIQFQTYILQYYPYFIINFYKLI